MSPQEIQFKKMHSNILIHNPLITLKDYDKLKHLTYQPAVYYSVSNNNLKQIKNV